ncbi:MBL fold metallo-hydrolase RNA specificity domain-containing protein [Novosphingobium album (ex Hu et al. 2023)]|uniref:MBL fold metallo-hydrolase n=1 Tax=Novosphingobium album (ex Hu et al. 2023) TaxID=2930093 RepID=A0ABT0B5H8_9SPHN|nr:MBL fold metallo-hydrolase [Novosphingobium album (ex Hu et al. 2023)]MCJ2180322.1 MBL fold metallo-hydrolase [Novosphingobium album (ex Hu et al. 2023)]
MTQPLTLTLNGAARTVTGSCHEFVFGKTRVLVDCGMFQGSRTLEGLNASPFGFNPHHVDAVVLTHAHIDHSGLLPRLVAEGFSGPIWCTQATADLLEYMLADSGRIHEADTARRNRRRDRAGEEPFEPLYTEADAMAAWGLCRPVEREEWFEPAPGFRARLWNAGHILGSASVEMEAGGTRVMCSGDIGPDNKAFHPDPEGPSGFDHVLCESTYGDRRRERVTIEARRKVLEAEIRGALDRGGNLLIPSFALERTQELLLDIVELLRAKAIPPVPVFIDSPLASHATDVFKRHAAELEDLHGSCVFTHPQLHFVESVQESIRLNSVSGAIILAASGMCEGGRIRHHLIHNLYRREATVLFVGYQAAGTLGRVILDGAQRVRISGQDVHVRASIRRIDSYSAHADQSELLDWVAARAPIHGSVFLVHGEDSGLETMRQLAQTRAPDATMVVPSIGETWELPAGAPARRTKTGREDIAQSLGHDWQNAYASFVTGLKRDLGRIEDEKAREEALAQMRKVLDSYAAHRDGRRRHAAEKASRER